MSYARWSWSDATYAGTGPLRLTSAVSDSAAASDALTAAVAWIARRQIRTLRLAAVTRAATW